MTNENDRAGELLHFGLWLETTVLMEFLSAAERVQLLSALGVSPADYEHASGAHLEALRDPARAILFHAARADATAGGREAAIARFNRFLDGLHDS